MVSRRDLFTGAAALVGAGVVSRVGAASLPEAVIMQSASTQVPPPPPNGRPYNPVVTLNGWSLPWRMNNGVKEFHLVAEPVVREFAPGMKANLWGYNGASPGPTIEVVEGDRVRIFVTNRLPEHTSVHWHGQRLPNGMDGVAGLTQKPIQPGKTMVYEFEAKRPGTFMYHPHADEMVQMAMGMMGFWVTHPKNPNFMKVDRDYVFLLGSYDIEPGSFVPKTSTMLNFNLFTFNSRVFPGIDSMVARQGERVRIRFGNLTMTNHPIHLHGHEFEVTGTDGGWTRPESRWPEVTVDVGVGQMRAIEFVASDLGDWAFHCHKSHHTMNAMGHDVPNMIGVSQSDVAKKISSIIPDYMAMGSTGGAMGEMEMPLPENTLPMMGGQGPFGGVEMGGMFTVMKVRKEQKRGDYSDPGWYKHPAGTLAYEWNGAPPEATRNTSAGGQSMPAGKPAQNVEFNVRKPSGHSGH
ncbi:MULTISPECIES: multicopper oxidase family protein [Oxalobacteraceae]|jgi:FtsP/CotA-like multicopper oxidase with cupredoxin domain|uniref:Multicopper oxidase with three cupredoxin domains (Includes cell division protein FtsP and spore coat protein CotA) n=1 Tax=Massilia yuzhufengensis TaxID=1164594 RepID=A0A1I1RGB8_9BURK|nr:MULTISPECIES: copper oxidase [Oxalobacteraceae]SFD29470.1 Multicopper oxidase with three cupredoxin domains (includes cell division protein FtsP and spore coat protein CotA) [Massilia yuzhufengensis]